MAFDQAVGPQWSSYDLPTYRKVNVDELIYTLTPLDLPLLTGAGSDGVPILPRVPVDNTKFEWQTDEVPLPRTVAAEDIDGTETLIDVAVGGAINFAPGDAVRMDNEVMLVTAIDTTNDRLTVVRGAAGTTAATHDNGSEVIGVGTILPEGDIGSYNFTGRDVSYNYTQIFSKHLRVTRTEQRMQKYGVPNELNRQSMNAMHSLWMSVEQAALYGTRYEDPASRRRSTGGLTYFISSNVDTSADWLTVDGIEVQQQTLYNAGGYMEFIMARPQAFAALNRERESRVQTVTVDDQRRGRYRATVAITEFGEVQLVRNRWVRSSDAFAYNRVNFVARVLAPMFTERLAKTNDTDAFMMVTELGFQVKGQEHMVRWAALDPTAPLPT
jgi:hypothetical protein